MKMIFLLVFLLIMSLSLFSQTVKVGTFPIPLMVEDENKGVFIELTKEILNRAGIKDYVIKINPPARTVQSFNNGELDLMFPSLDVNFADLSKITRTKEPIYIKRDFVFTLKGDKLLKSIKDLEGKRVGLTMGYPYVKELTDNKKITFDFAQDDIANTKKLESKRIDAFVVEEGSGLQAFKDSGLRDKIQYDPATPLSQQDVYYAAQGTKAGKELSDKLVKAISAMKTDGTLDKILSKTR